ncbi:MAG: hypothetical protein AUG06_04045 [Actinobacteria bacterium 13_1_20CM_2_65_11]|nr:MAG: hypothetical protein AUH40_05815 [Chloroflexi bacterium 13_1_40CM_65_17]OLD49291.1 MAG: hypothetical protein AUI42_08705 [Actinobacteria bacterium 13_1_40CM_2_65_8]OLE80638.1 MAG: hypothetical protein AUG06_04045 [Actinobacteria bacterium 13_1_20CM_2_65_11]
MEADEDLRMPLKRGRIERAFALMAISVVAIGIATFNYVQPRVSSVSTPRPPADAGYQLAAIHFVDPSTGWVVAELPSHAFVVLHTKDSGRSWMQQLMGSGGDIGEYAYFDRSHVVLVTLGPHAVIFQTGNAGEAWSRSEIRMDGGKVLSADFIDASTGWLLVQSAAGPIEAPFETLYGTFDGGTTWRSLGDPVVAGDWAYRAVFADSDRGWLFSLSSGPYAYRTADGGESWQRVPLPGPGAGWPVAPPWSLSPERFFVGANITAGAGVMATVVPIAPPHGRSADGLTLLAYPPFTVRAFDGGGAVTYVYTTFGDTRPYRYTSILSEAGQMIAPLASGQVELSSLDGGSNWRNADVPSAYGALGFTDALDWWWIGGGAWATSSDGGITWGRTRLIGVLPPLPGSLQILDPDHAWFGAMAGNRSMLEMTSDGGYEWTAISLPPIAKPTPASAGD